MMTFLGGIIAMLVGFIFLGFWWKPFIELVMGAIPLVIILGGILAAYLGYEEYKDDQALARQSAAASPDPEAERYKQEAEKYKAELETLKQQQDDEETSE